VKKLFSGYYRPDSADLERLWSKGTFVFDTNVLLDLYSYPETVREVFLSVLRKISDRIWIPYQVGIEFHRNRFSRIRQSNQRVEKLFQTIQNTGKTLAIEVQEIELEKRNIGVSDIQERLSAVQKAHQALSEAVQLACEKLPPISLDDKIGGEICSLFEGKVGLPPVDQAFLDNLIADGQDRYDKKIPPGYADVAAKGEDVFRDRGVSYPRKYGDLILWRQLLAFSEDDKKDVIVFITGDKKKDWWWIEDGKTLGPLPELVQEITSTSGVEVFWMYSADQFLENAENFLKATEVTAETVEQVKEFAAKEKALTDLLTTRTSELLTKPDSAWRDFALFLEGADRPYLAPSARSSLLFSPNETSAFSGFKVDEAVRNWLLRVYPEGEILQTKNFPDFIVKNHGFKSGYDLKFVRQMNPRAFPPSVVNTLLRGYLEVNEGRLNDFSIVFAVSDDGSDQLMDAKWHEEMTLRGNALLSKYPAHSLIIGYVIGETFEPCLIIGNA